MTFLVRRWLYLSFSIPLSPVSLARHMWLTFLSYKHVSVFSCLEIETEALWRECGFRRHVCVSFFNVQENAFKFVIHQRWHFKWLVSEKCAVHEWEWKTRINYMVLLFLLSAYEFDREKLKKVSWVVAERLTSLWDDCSFELKNIKEFFFTRLYVRI